MTVSSPYSARCSPAQHAMPSRGRGVGSARQDGPTSSLSRRRAQQVELHEPARQTAARGSGLPSVSGSVTWTGGGGGRRGRAQGGETKRLRKLQFVWPLRAILIWRRRVPSAGLESSPSRLAPAPGRSMYTGSPRRQRALTTAGLAGVCCRGCEHRRRRQRPEPGPEPAPWAGRVVVAAKASRHAMLCLHRPHVHSTCTLRRTPLPSRSLLDRASKNVRKGRAGWRGSRWAWPGL